MNSNTFIDELNRYGELHVFLESDAEFHLHKHDVGLTKDGRVEVDSKHGTWRFDPERIEHVDYPHSHKEE